MDIVRAAVVQLAEQKTRRRLESITKQWRIIHAITYGISCDQVMACNKASHSQFANTAAAGVDQSALTKAAARSLGIESTSVAPVAAVALPPSAGTPKKY